MTTFAYILDHAVGLKLASYYKPVSIVITIISQ